MTTEVFASLPPYSGMSSQPVQKPCLMRLRRSAERLYLPGRDGPAGDCLGSISQAILKCLIISNHKRLHLINGLWRYTSQFRRLTTPRSHSESFMFYVPEEDSEEQQKLNRSAVMTHWGNDSCLQSISFLRDPL